MQHYNTDSVNSKRRINDNRRVVTTCSHDMEVLFPAQFKEEKIKIKEG